jgi:hypothetical protein
VPGLQVRDVGRGCVHVALADEAHAGERGSGEFGLKVYLHELLYTAGSCFCWPGLRVWGLDCGLSPKIRSARAGAFGLCSKSQSPSPHVGLRPGPDLAPKPNDVPACWLGGSFDIITLRLPVYGRLISLISQIRPGCASYLT